MGLPSRPGTKRRLGFFMTQAEKAAAQALYTFVTFQPGSFDKKWCRGLAERTNKPLSEKGQAFLVKMLYKYRAQIPDFTTRYQNLIKEYEARNLDGRTG